MLALSNSNVGISDGKIIDESLIVSLTTYSKRIHEVYLVIESIMQQTILPNKIILWLDETEFNYETIPSILKKANQKRFDNCILQKSEVL